MPPARGLAPELRLVRSEAEEQVAAGSDIPDDALVSRVASHDAGAFEMLYRRHTAFALNLAVRIQSFCDPGRILMCEETARLAQGAVATRPKTEVPVKHVARAVAVFEVA